MRGKKESVVQVVHDCVPARLIGEMDVFPEGRECYYRRECQAALGVPGDAAALFNICR